MEVLQTSALPLGYAARLRIFVIRLGYYSIYSTYRAAQLREL